ncbi:MAG: DNA-binding protein [Saprospiraceae bacterium]|jgi:predicted transcriptional regulator|uniref:DNA-binding protein n=1 Tax=Candidatus Brachybacter algidus TaxID=2982024 RepID=UPI001B48F082|nr:DNA-binding protein [Candidatus Brachybacter algidus]MBP7304593.1 DNA-binding protein [Saprospiraceae bacterium]MBK6372738.1 DNA-binding protein [Candidatus Brachybacter algidus]MBK6448292.1 DNA-binding protein [Candidatus Brachybacter algidus]MBK7605513.1 DNA-binding protein [Candidatus Brachybacter algidus]MBK8354222.1 DNA-binding protein [Candidatus Brachybacter algidus]
MNITFDELRQIKHSLPTGSISKIAQDLEIDEQTVRNYFGGDHYNNGDVVDLHIEPGPSGGIVNVEDTRIIEAARKIIGGISNN